jgi:hypothetical protein
MLVATASEDQGDKVCRVYTSSAAKLLEAPDPATGKPEWPGIAQDWIERGRYGNHNAIDHDEIATPRKTFAHPELENHSHSANRG